MSRETDGVAEGERLRRRVVAGEQLRLMSSYGKFGWWVAAALSVAMALHVLRVTGDRFVWSWLAVKLLIMLARILWLKSPERVRGDDERAMNTFAILLFLDGLAWGYLGMKYASMPPVEATVLAMSIACLGSFAAIGLQSSLRCAMAYVVPMVGITAVCMAYRGDELGAISGVVMGIFLLAMIVVTKMGEQMIGDLVSLRVLASQLAQERADDLVETQRQLGIKKSMLSRMSHELRSPLQGVIGLADAINQDTLDQAHKRRTALISGSAKHILKIVENTLDRVRIEAGELRLTTQCFELGEFADEIAQTHSAQASARGRCLHTKLKGEFPYWTVGDKARLRQIIDNLVSNALKFTHDGGTVALSVQVDKCGEVSFVVSDNGKGMSEDEVARLFTPFPRIRNSDVGGMESMGLGLSIAQDLAVAMGGRIQCQSTEGKGSTFSFKLKMSRDDVPGPAVVKLVNQSSVSNWRFNGMGRRALVVEDDDVAMMVVGQALERSGWEVQYAHDGKEAVDLLMDSHSKIAVVVMDCEMPVMSGLEAIKAIRQLEAANALPRKPILGMTGHSGRHEHEQMIAAGMSDVMCKPFSVEELRERMFGLLEKRAGKEKSLPGLESKGISQALGGE